MHERILQEFAEYGFSLYAVEEKRGDKFIGFIGFHHATLDIGFCPCVEIGWRLDKHFWGKGYATEGAKACLDYGFRHLDFDEVYSFTAIINKPSQRVMQKVGLQLDHYFDHPEIPKDNRLKPHVCYRMTKHDHHPLW